MCKKQYAYSLDGETFMGTFDSIDEARIEAATYDKYKTIWVGTIAYPDPADYICIDRLIEQIEENLNDDFWWLDCDVKKTIDKDTFESKIKTAVREHIKPKVFSVENSNEYQNH